MGDELRNAWRGLRAAPGTSALAFVILTLGIASTTVTFSVVDTIALRRMPFPEASRLVAIGTHDHGNPRPGPNAPQDFFTWRAQTTSLERLAATVPGSLSIASGGRAEQLVAHRITANLFNVLRVRPALGATFSEANELAGQDQVVILSHAAWQRLFDADAKVVGRQVTFGKETRTVVGVMPAGFTYPIGPARATDAWVPYIPRLRDLDHASTTRSYGLHIVARLKPDARLEQAREQVERATAAVVAAYPNQSFWQNSRPVVIDLQEYVVGPAGRWLVLMLGAVGLVLVIAHLNVANLLFARATVRSRELALRVAIGATRFRIARMLVAESLLLSLAAVAFGIVIAIWGVSLASVSLPAGLARASSIALDLRVLTVATVASITTGLVFGVLPAWHGAHADTMAMMKEGGVVLGAGGRRARWQRALLVAELAFVVTVLVAALLFVVSFVKVVQTDLGFTRQNLAAVPVFRSLANVPEAERTLATEAFISDVLARTKAVAGVRNAALVDGNVPLFGGMTSYSIRVEGYGETKATDMPLLRQVTPDYFEVVGVPLLHGRSFSEGESTSPVAIINDEAVRRFFGGRNPVGERIEFQQKATTIVGVVGAVRLLGPEANVLPELYVPLPYSGMSNSSVSYSLLVRLTSTSLGVLAAVREAVKPINASTQQPMDVDQRFRTLTAERRFNAVMMAIFGLLALGMAAVGVYGLMSFVVAQRRREIGIRRALGAATSHIFRDVLIESGRVLGVALTLGLLGGWAASHLFTTVVFNVTGGEPALYVGIAITVGATVLAATILPARRATRVDPLTALRTE